MRRFHFALLSLVVVMVVGLGTLKEELFASAPTTLPTSVPELRVGETISVFLIENKSRALIQGRLDYMDEKTLRLEGEVKELVGDGFGKVNRNTREVTTWVPRSNILFIERTNSTKSESDETSTTRSNSEIK